MQGIRYSTWYMGYEMRDANVMSWLLLSLSATVPRDLVHVSASDGARHGLLSSSSNAIKCWVILHVPLSEAEFEVVISSFALQRHTVRCDMVLHQAFRARGIRRNDIGGELRHGVTQGVSCVTSKA